jgi:pimeloyl-ACP methyl ester carboxylesterase
LLGIVLLILVLLGAGIIYQAIGSAADTRNYPPPGQLVDVGGFQMHIQCQGEGSPTVILESLSGGFSSYWGWVQPEVAQSTRVCAYDRPGFGWSEADPQPKSVGRTVENLHTLLENAGIAGPYVLVGHSIGGLFVRAYAADYPADVAGIMLIDSSHPDQNERVPAFGERVESDAADFSFYTTMAQLGVFRLYLNTGGSMDFNTLPAQQVAEVRAAWSSPAYFEAQRTVILDAPRLFSEAQRLGDLGDLPLVVFSADSDLAEGWAAMQDELGQLSTNAVHRVVEGTTHASFIFDPDDAHTTSQASVGLVAAARDGVPVRQVVLAQ